MSAHTPGPWHVRLSPMAGGGTRVENILSDNGSQICEGLFWGDNAESDARLIAAAPELLEAIIGLIGDPNTDQSAKPFMAAIEVARAAIAKATGKESP